MQKIIRYFFILPLLIFLFCHCVKAQGGYTLDFDGTNDYLEIPYNATLNPSGSFSIECWAKVEGGAGTWRSPLCSRAVPAGGDTRGYLFYAGTDNQWQFWTGSTGVAFSEVNSNEPVQNEWTHLAGTFDGSTLRIYVNGVLANSGGGTYTANPDRPTRIGAGNTEGTPPGGAYFPGKVDDVRIWSDVRTQAEIQTNMHKELVGNEANLVGYYQMSDGTGTSLTDNSTNSNTGTLTNGPVWKTSGVHAGPDMALDFDGTDDNITIPDANDLDFANDFTLEGWINPTAFSGYGRMISKDDAYSLGFSATVIRFTTYNVLDYDLTYSIPTGTWTHVAITMDTNNDVIFYVNGINVGTITGTTPATITTEPVLLGSSTYSLIEDFNGALDEIRIWSDVRTEAEIRANKDRTLDGSEANLVAYYRLDQQADAGNITAYDLSGNGHDGTLTNMVPASDWVASNPFNTWIGSEDTDWTNADNWSMGTVPTSTIDIGIYDWSGSNAPSLGGTANGRNMYIGNGETFTNTGTATLTGNFINDGTQSGSGSTVFSGTAAQIIDGAGTTTIGVLTIDNSAGVSLEKDVTTTTMALTDGALDIGANTLTINGAISQTTGSFTGGSTSNIGIGGAGASTALPAVTVNNLTLNRANGITLGGNVTVEGALTLTSGILNLNANSLVLGDASTIAGSPGNSNHINATSGNVQKGFASDGNFTYPVGDGTDYTPIDLDFTASGYSSASATVSLTAAKHPNNSSPTNFIDRYWTVNSTGITSFSCDVSATYANGDINGDEAVMKGGKWNGSAWTLLDDVTSASNLITGTVTSFSDFTAGESSVFPVEWLSFEATPQDDRVLLDWATAQEFNSDFFEVERSTDQNTWTKLGKVDAVGNATQPTNYDFVDQNPFIGTASYRLRQVDIDGQFNFSPIVEVTILEEGVAVYPNPLQNELHIDLGEKRNLYVTLLDLTGRKMLEVHYSAENNSMQLEGIPSGTYILHLTDKQGWVRKKKIVKQ